MPDRSLATLLGDPDYYLDRIDSVEGRATFVHSDRNRLGSAVFLDGRAPFATGDSQSIELGNLIIPSRTVEPDPRRFIFHMSFCGSTQLSHLIHGCGAAVVLKEPHALVDLADWHRTMCERNCEDLRFDPTLDCAIALLMRRWPGAGPTVVKPSNWANSLLPDLTCGATGTRIVLITIGRRAFLRAVFRGGRERLAFTSRVAAHLAGAGRRFAAVDEAVSGVSDPFDQVARFALLAHSLQEQLFAQAASEALAGVALIEYELILNDPREALCRAIAALNLEVADDAVATALSGRAARNSKSPGRPFTIAGQQEEDRLVEHYHAERFDRALAWAERQ